MHKCDAILSLENSGGKKKSNALNEKNFYELNKYLQGKIFNFFIAIISCMQNYKFDQGQIQCNR